MFYEMIWLAGNGVNWFGGNMKIGKLAIKWCARRWLVGLAVLALWTPAKFASAQVATNANSVPTTKILLTEKQQQKLAALLLSQGDTVPLRTTVTTALGLTREGEVLTLRQLMTTDGKKLDHVYIRCPDGGLILAFFPNGAWCCSYRFNSNLKLVAAVSKRKGVAPVVIPLSEAEAESQNQLSYWASIADEFGPKSP